MIDKDISFLVQGPVDALNTPIALDSIRRHFPNAEIILSTWENTNSCASELYDLILFNKDPGGFIDPLCNSFTNNLLRQLVSTQAALKKCSRPYIFKSRSDISFKSDKTLKLFDKYATRSSEFAIFNKRIITSSFFSKKYLRHGGRVHPAPFHISDWLAFGTRDDIFTLYDIPLPKEPEYSHYFKNAPYNGSKTNLMGCAHQYAPEQYIFFNVVKKFFPYILFRDYMDYTDENIKYSERIIANNFSIFYPTELGVICLKKKNNNDSYNRWTKHPFQIPYNLWKGLYRPDVFDTDYHKFCDSAYSRPLSKTFLFAAERYAKEFFRLNEYKSFIKHASRFLAKKILP